MLRTYKGNQFNVKFKINNGVSGLRKSTLCFCLNNEHCIGIVHYDFGLLSRQSSNYLSGDLKFFERYSTIIIRLKM